MEFKSFFLFLSIFFMSSTLSLSSELEFYDFASALDFMDNDPQYVKGTNMSTGVIGADNISYGGPICCSSDMELNDYYCSHRLHSNYRSDCDTPFTYVCYETHQPCIYLSLTSSVGLGLLFPGTTSVVLGFITVIVILV